MAIEFHCDHCGAEVRTADENAGKRGKCPRCKQSVYIPTPREKIEPLPFADDDQTTPETQDDEAKELLESLRDERGEIPEVQPESIAESEGDVRLPTDFEAIIIEYARAMAAGNLEEAEKCAAQIRHDMQRAEEVMQRFEMDEIPHEQLADIPPPVLRGFFKQLRQGE